MNAAFCLLPQHYVPLPLHVSSRHVPRVYLILHHVLKELSSKRLVADQAQFAQVGVGWGAPRSPPQQSSAASPRVLPRVHGR